MGIEFHPDQWLEIFKNNPVLIVLVAGTVGGTAATQIVKQLWLAFFNAQVATARYKAIVRLVAVLATFAFTNELWETFIGEHGSGLRHVVSLTSAVASPFTYVMVRAAIAWKFPAFAARLGGNPPPPKPPTDAA